MVEKRIVLSLYSCVSGRDGSRINSRGGGGGGLVDEFSEKLRRFVDLFSRVDQNDFLKSLWSKAPILTNFSAPQARFKKETGPKT